MRLGRRLLGQEYCSRSDSAGRSRVEEAREEEGRDESVVWHGWVDGGREGSNCCMSRLLLDIGPPLSCHLEQLDTVYSF